jgi:hypothetical protein
VSNEFEIMWKRAVVGSLEGVHRHSSRDSEKYHEISESDIRSTGPNLNQNSRIRNRNASH